MHYLFASFGGAEPEDNVTRLLTIGYDGDLGFDQGSVQSLVFWLNTPDFLAGRFDAAFALGKN